MPSKLFRFIDFSGKFRPVRSNNLRFHCQTFINREEARFVGRIEVKSFFWCFSFRGNSFRGVSFLWGSFFVRDTFANALCYRFIFLFAIFSPRPSRARVFRAFTFRASSAAIWQAKEFSWNIKIGTAATIRDEKAARKRVGVHLPTFLFLSLFFIPNAWFLRDQYVCHWNFSCAKLIFCHFIPQWKGTKVLTLNV